MRRAAWLVPPVAFVVLLYVVPILAVAFLGAGVGAADPSGRSIADLLQSPYYRSRILFTFWQAALSTLLTLLVGVPLSYIFATRQFPGRRILRAAFTVPFVMPPLVLALALQSFIGRGSLFATRFDVSPLSWIGPLGAILLAHAVYNISLIIRIVGASWERFPPALGEAAATLGANPARIFWSIRFPIAATAIAAASILVFLFCASSFGIILLLGGDQVGTLETLIFEEVASFRPHYDTASLLGLLQLFTTLVAVALYVVVSHRARSTYTPNILAPARRPSLLQCAALVAGALIVIGPFLTLLVEAFRYHGTWSLEPVRILLANKLPLGSYTVWQSLRTSLVFALMTLFLALPLALASLYAFRSTGRGTRWWQTMLLLPLGTSAVLIGLGYLLVFDGSPFPDLRAHPSRIILAHVLIAYPFTTRVLSPAFDALNPALLEAGRTLGARLRQLILRIELPLMRPALLAAGVFAFAVSLGEFGATLLLRRPEFNTLPLALFDAYSRPGEGFRAQAEVLALLLALVALGSFWLMEHVRKDAGGDLL